MSSSDFEILPQMADPVYQSYELLSANDGGGIIVLPLRNTEAPKCQELACKAHFDIIFKEKDNFIESLAIEGIEQRENFPVNISVLVPCQVPLLKKYDEHYYQKRHICSGAFGHLESAKDNVFVAIVGNSQNRGLPSKYQSLLTQVAGGFNLKLRYIDDTPATIKNEKPHWFRYAKYQFYWFALERYPGDIQRCFAMLFYCALSLRKLMGIKMSSVLLAAQIDTFPQGNLSFMLTEEDILKRQNHSHFVQ